MAKYVVDDTDLTQVANAIRTANGSSSSLSFPTGFVSGIQSIEGGGGGSGSSSQLPTAQYNDVIFIDYDGTIRYSYSAADFANLTALPANPSHTGLTAQGWNWTLADAKTAVANTGYLTIGQNYVTDDGKTRIYITLGQHRKSPVLGIGVNGTVDIDWGDGTEHSTLTGTGITTTKWTSPHEYATSGNYVIKLTVTGSAAFVGTNTSGNASQLLHYSNKTDNRNNYYQLAINKIEIGTNITRFYNSAFQSCHNIKSITMPTSVNYSSLGNYTFRYCYSLKGLVIPSTTSEIGTYCFGNCTLLQYIALPKNYITLNSSTFESCYNLKQVYVYNNQLTTFPSSYFKEARQLRKFILPTKITTISGSAFYACYSLQSITFPSTVTTLNDNVLRTCYGLKELRFLSTSPPTGVGSTTFQNIPTDCIIYVPNGSLSAYTSASNYPSSSTYTYVQEAATT